MSGETIEVIQGVFVLAVSERGKDLYVDIYGGDQNVCGSIRFAFPDGKRRRAMRSVLHRWCRHRTPVTFVSRGSTIALQDDRALFDDLVEPSGS